MANLRDYKGKTFEVDDEGFLCRPEDWCDEWMECIKQEEQVQEITDAHRKILNFLRDYYKKNGLAPMVRILSKSTGFKLKEIYELFPTGPSRGGCRLAGLPNPAGCV